MRFNLPFPRGETARGGAAGTAPVGVGVIGATFIDYDQTRDTVNNRYHGTRVTMLLRPVQNDSGSAINFSTARLRKALRCSTANSTSWIQATNGFCGATAEVGQFAHVIDDAYGTHATFADQDVVYTVAQGPCLVAMATGATGPQSSSASNAGTPMAVRRGGGFGRALTGNVIIGVAMQTFSDNRTGQTILMHVGHSFGGVQR